jgi:outer membrane lipoprotein-sorting protein
MIRRFSFLLACLCLAGSAVAGPKDDLHAAFTKFLAQSSFKGTTTATVNGKTIQSVIEFQAPDRYRISSEGRPPSVIIGGSMYININGRFMKMPTPPSIAEYRDPSVLARIESSLSADDLGADVVGGEPTHKYRYTVSQPRQSTTIVWVSTRSGLPVQLQNSGAMMGKTINSQVNYANYSDPSIKISAPN